MAETFTEYYELGMQEDKTDKFSMDVLNSNAVKLDSILHDFQLQIDALKHRIEDLEAMI